MDANSVSNSPTPSAASSPPNSVSNPPTSSAASSPPSQQVKDPLDMQTRYTEDFEEIGLLGKGAYGGVYICTHKMDDATYAVKKIGFPHQQCAAYLREVKILASLKHPGVIRYYQCWIEDGVAKLESSEDEAVSEGSREPMPTKTLFVAMEKCKSSLRDVLGKQIERDTIYRYLKEILEALDYIHSNNVIHGDMSRDNILLDDQDHIRIADFGLARFIEDNSTPLGSGNPTYKAPELSISPKSDMFAVGLVLFEMAYPMKTDAERREEFHKLKTSSVVEHGKVDDEFTKIINRLSKKDPKQRPSASDLLLDYFP